MVARLPNVASDNDQWGEILNEYLLVGHRADGTHKLGWVVTEHGADNQGINDSADAINAVIQASSPGDAIVFPGGRYILNTPLYLLPERTYFGMGRPTLIQKPNTVMDFMVGPEPGILGFPRTKVVWNGIDLDGNRAFNVTWPTSQPTVYATLNFTGAITGWYNSGSAVVAHDAAVGRTALGSLKLTASAAGNPAASTTALSGQGIAVVPERSYTFSAYTQAGSAARTVNAAIDWYNGTTFLSRTTGASVTNGTGSWTQCTVTGVAPAGANLCAVRVIFSSVANTEVHYVDDAAFTESFNRNHAIAFDDLTDSLFQNFTIRESANMGIRLGGTSTRVRFNSVTVDNAVNSAYYTDANAADNHATSCVFTNSGGGAELSGVRNTVNNCSLRDNDLSGVRVFANGCSVVGCTIEGNGRYGVYVGPYADYLMVAANNIFNNSREVTATYEGILLAGDVGKTVRYVSILSNVIYSNNNAAAGQHLRAITLGTYHQYARVNGNAIDNNASLGLPATTNQVNGLTVGDVYQGVRVVSSGGMPTQVVDGETVWVDDLDRRELWSVDRARWERIPSYKRDIQAGTVTLTLAATTHAVAITDMGDTNYAIAVLTTYATTWRVSAKTSTGFTITFGTMVPAGTQTMEWQIARYT